MTNPDSEQAGLGVETAESVADFLLARIAEDEERALFVKSQQVDDPQPLNEGYRWHDEYDLLYVPPVRVLAECEVKRQIVEYATGQHTSSPEGYDILRLLALPYADHADYRDDWRP